MDYCLKIFRMITKNSQTYKSLFKAKGQRLTLTLDLSPNPGG
jgi:hypothetical protein